MRYIFRVLPRSKIEESNLMILPNMLERYRRRVAGLLVIDSGRPRAEYIEQKKFEAMHFLSL